jgi:hypothetical protein
MESYGSMDKKTAARCGSPFVELLGFWMVNGTDDAHFSLAPGADKRICFIDLADKVRPALL